ncbi:MAG: hypothetical protein ACTHJM_03400, partial [Marmoricola sp.]
WDMTFNFSRVQATMTDTLGHPLPGLTVQFSTTKPINGAAISVCSAVTDSSGVATCTNNVNDVIREMFTNGYDATYAGSVDYTPATDHTTQH